MDSYLSHHGILGQKWGVRRYQNYDGTLTPAGRERYGESKQLASQLFEKAKAHEPRITKDVMDSVNGTSAKMYGLEYKLKTEESLTRKIRTDSEEKKITPFDAASDIKDGVRYTALSPDNDFTSNYYKIKDSLEKKGYSEVRCKNYFDLYRQGQVKHKSVQSVFQSDDGYLFEMQFQTPESQDAKDKKVPIYEERRKPGLSKERQEALERQMVELAENVPDPKDVYKIKTHSGVKHSLGGDSMTYDELVHSIFSDEEDDDHLEHHGILGMKWGVRRYQNEDGSLTPAGRERYQKGLAKEVAGKMQKRESIYDSDVTRNIASKSNTLSKLVKSYKEAGQYANSVINRANKDSVYAKTISEKVKNRWLDRYKAEGKSEQELADEKKYWESGEWLGSMDDTNAVLLSDKEYSKMVDSQTKLQNEWEEEYPKLVNDVLGKHGSEKVKIQPEYGKAYNDTVSGYVNGQLRYLGIDLSADKDLEEKILGHSLDSDDHLEHHGILGMKWYRRRFQNEDGSLTPAGRERYGVGKAQEGSGDKPKKPGIVERHKQKKEEKRKAAEKAARVKRMQEGKARKAEEKKSAEEHEAAKQKALRSAKASEIMKYREELTDQEMKDAVARIGWDEALRKKAKEENPDKLTKAMKVVDKYGKAAGSIATATENTTKMYNNIAKALNTFTGSDWPLVGDSKKDQNSSDKGNDKPNNKPNNKPNEGKPSKKDKENFEKTMKEAAKILGEAAKKVDEESKKQAEDKHDWTVNDKPASNSSSSSSSGDKGVFDTKFEYSDAKAERAEQIGRDAVERYLQLEDKRKG